MKALMKATMSSLKKNEKQAYSPIPVPLRERIMQKMHWSKLEPQARYHSGDMFKHMNEAEQSINAIPPLPKPKKQSYLRKAHPKSPLSRGSKRIRTPPMSPISPISNTLSRVAF
jgi:hypothetical protein